MQRIKQQIRQILTVVMPQKLPEKIRETVKQILARHCQSGLARNLRKKSQHTRPEG